MLTALSIQNFVTIESQIIDFKPGFNVITGETGAGKSLVLKALQFLFGGKLPITVLKKSDSSLQITGTFTANKKQIDLLAERGISITEGDPILIRRTLAPDGKTRCFINDQMSTTATIKDLAPLLFSLQNQFDQVLSPAAQLSVMDRAGDLSEICQDLQSAYQAWTQAVHTYTQLKEENDKRQQEREFIEKAHEELEKLAVQEHEEDHLLEQRQKAKNQGQNHQILQECLSLLNPDEGSQLWYKVSKKLSKLQTTQEESGLEKHLETLIDSYQTFSEELTQQAYLSAQDMSLDADQIEQRLHSLRSASRKYNCSIADLPEKQAHFAEQARLLHGGTKDLKAQQQHVQQTKQHYIELAENLNAKRVKVANHLCQLVEKELPQLMLEKLKLKVSNDPLPENQWSSNGMYKIQLMVQPNVDAPFTPLDQAASGGERSRLFLAFEKVSAHLKQCPTLFFDEVDKGVGGAVAHAVGHCLLSIGQHHQVIAISHAPQVAALADHHILVEKHHYADKTISRTQAGLDPETKLAEISRMLSGKTVTVETTAAAQSLIAQKQ